jgi:hypothetical protein
MLTMVWIVTYRLNSKSGQTEVKKYTPESANAFAQTIQELGGVAVITEDIEPSPAADEQPELSRNSLDWSDNG